MDKAWYVIQSKPRKEYQLSEYLRSQGHEVFYPTIKMKPVNPRASTVRPFFPRYLFVRVNLDEVGVSALRWIPFAIGLVQFDGYAAPLPDHIINELKQRVKMVEEAGGLTLHGLQSGDAVRITYGPLAGYEAVFDTRLSGSERSQVLLEMLGRLVKVQIDTNALSKK